MSSPLEAVQIRAAAELALRQRRDYGRYARNPVDFALEVLRVSQLTKEQVNILHSIRDRSETNVQAAHGVGKCVRISRMITLSSGLRCSAGSLVGKEFELLTVVDGAIKPAKAKAAWNRFEPIYKLTTESGREIECNAQHPLWVANKSSRSGKHPKLDVLGWTQTQAIQPGQLVAVTANLPVFGTVEVPDYEIKLLAYLIGDGGYTSNNVVFTQQDGAQLQEFKACAESIGCDFKPAGKYGWRLSKLKQAKPEQPPKVNAPVDLSCEAFISTVQALKRFTVKLSAFYNRLKVTGIKPVEFYGRAYISASELAYLEALDFCLQQTAVGKGRGDMGLALQLLEEQRSQINPHPVSLEVLQAALDQVLAVRQQQREQGKQPYPYIQPSNAVAQLLTDHGMRFKHSRDKFIPGVVFSLPKAQVAIFLSRLYSTDGWAHLRKDRGVEIGFASVSHQLCLDVQELLLRFGINAWIDPKTATKSYTVRIGASADAIRFCEEIGIHGKEKQVAVVLKEARRMSHDRRVQRWRERDIQANLRWESVKSVEYIGDDQTVAIEVPGHHHYLTNFWEHNSFISAIAVLWWVFAVKGLAISTAPTKSQVEQILWSEIRKLYDANKAKLGGTRNELSVKLTENARAYGFTAKNYDSNSFQGKHAEKLLLIQDESCGITEQIDEGFDSCLTGAENRGLRIGNPIETNTPFQRACAKNHVRIPAWDHPNVSWAYDLCDDGIHRLKPDVSAKILKPEDQRGDDPVKAQGEWAKELPRDRIPGAISINWIEKVRAKKGEGSKFWKTRVEGMFAIDSQASIIPRRSFIAARKRYDDNPAYWDALAKLQPWRHGMDVGDGNDEHALSSWRGPVLFAIDKMATQGDEEDTSRAARWGFDTLQRRSGSVGIDNIGVGAGALSELRGSLREAQLDPDTAFGICFGGSPTADPDDDETFIAENLKTELYWTLREAMRKGEVAIAPLGEYEDEVMDDLAGTYYEETTKGKTKIEDKEKTRKRLHRSPDCGDAVIYGWAPMPERSVWGVSNASWGY